MRSAPQRGLHPAISRMSAARVVGGRPDRRERRRQNARNPARCQRRMVAGWTSRVASRQAGDSRGENNREALPGRPPNAPGKLPPGNDELLSKKPVLGDQFDATANEIRGQSENESKKVDHGSSLTPSARMTFVARTGVVLRLTRVADRLELASRPARATRPRCRGTMNRLRGADFLQPPRRRRS